MTNPNIKLPNFLDDVYFFNHGNHTTAYKFLGSQRIVEGGDVGYQFSVWAPNASLVMIQGDFTQWNYWHMDRIEGGIWVIYIAGDLKGQHYKYAIDNGEGHIEHKIDPFAFRFERPPKDSSIVWDNPSHTWQDEEWMSARKTRNHSQSPLHIYEVHASSWRKHPDGRDYTFAELAETLIPYVKQMGYTHIEFLPLMDHPLDASWGYQVTGFYAISATYGTLDEFKVFVDRAHQEGLGVIMDWVPGHFSRNANGLAYYDGTPTFEPSDYNKANNIGWGTLNFDLGRDQVRSFLISNALFWLKEFHLDGMRVDAVSNMLYLDFSEGPWTPNVEGTNIYLEGVEFLQKLNTTVHAELPDVLMMAEESTDWVGITHPVAEGGLGFDYKWNMGWMNDTLKFFEMDPLYRPKNLRLITFVYMYQYNEKFILPYSHDEVVHGKDSMLGKMPGDRYNQFATLRVVFGYMMAQPGKILHFMGNEIGQFLEWRFYEELEWIDLTREFNSEFQHYMATINHIGLDNKALHELDHEPDGLTILDADNTDEGVLTFIRHSSNPKEFILVICNFVPVQRDKVRIGVPFKGEYTVLMNSEMEEFGGSWQEDLPDMKAEEIPYNNQQYSIETIVPAASVLYIVPKKK